MIGIMKCLAIFNILVGVPSRPIVLPVPKFLIINLISFPVVLKNTLELASEYSNSNPKNFFYAY